MLSQLVVTTFLFYSGYGILETIKHKGQRYIDNIPMKILLLIINFTLAILVYYVIGTFLGREIPLSKLLLLSCIGWESIGNSNWYLFDILALYAVTYVAFKIENENRKVSLLYVLIFSLGIMMFVHQYRDGARWYNTLLCYWVGMVYSFYKCDIDHKLMKSTQSYIMYGGIVALLFWICYQNRDHMLFYILHGILFALMITIVMMVVKMENPILLWVGRHIFGIYILQRIPMMLGSKISFIQENSLIYLLLSVVITLLLAEIFERITKKIAVKIAQN